ncbi:MAG: hypothetical protein HS132_18785 [Planctomycetia bacterium]|nr:hypothetical protein [Planctomycetia bacterium]
MHESGIPDREVTVSGVRTSIKRRNIVTDVEQREAGRWMSEDIEKEERPSEVEKTLSKMEKSQSGKGGDGQNLLYGRNGC